MNLPPWPKRWTTTHNSLDINNKHAESRLAMVQRALGVGHCRACKLLGEDNLAVAASLQTLGAILRRVMAVKTQAEFNRSEKGDLLLRRWRSAESCPGTPPTDLANTLTSLGLCG